MTPNRGSERRSESSSPPTLVRVEGLDRNSLRRLLDDRGVHFNDAAEALFADQRFVPSSSPRDVPITTLSVAELGLDGGATYERLVACARSQELTECSLELAAYLRLSYLEQPAGATTQHNVRGAPTGSITVASPPLDSTYETPKGFYLRHFEGKLWLRGYRATDDHLWRPEDVFVFERAQPGTA